MGHLELSAHMTVRPGCLEGFKKQAAELVRITKQKGATTGSSAWMARSARFVRRTPARKDWSSTTATSSTLEPRCSRTTPTVTS